MYPEILIGGMDGHGRCLHLQSQLYPDPTPLSRPV